MKIYLSSDMEGTAGVVDWNQCLAGNPEYEYYRGLLQNEVNAAIIGAQTAGAKKWNGVGTTEHGTTTFLQPYPKRTPLIDGCDTTAKSL